MPIIGIVENMSYFVSPDGEKHQIFGEGGGARLAKRLATQLIGQIPIEPEVTGANNDGVPIAVSENNEIYESDAAVALRELAHEIVTTICPPVELATCTAHMAELIAALDK